MIQALALRIAAQRALAGATIAENRVYDSAISAIDELLGEGPSPVIVISTEDQEVSTSGSDVLAGSRTIELVIEVAFAGKSTHIVKLSEDEEAEETQIAIPQTDAGLEMSLAVLCRQVERALFGTQTGWGSVFLALASDLAKAISKRGAGAVKDSTKFAARQTTYTIKPFAEPEFGKLPEANTPLANFLAALDADPAVSRWAPVIRAAIKGDPVADWREAYASFGMTDEQARGIGIGPYILGLDGNPVQLDAVDYDSPLGDITEAAADQLLPPEETP